MADDELDTTDTEQGQPVTNRAERAAEGGMAIADMLSALSDDSQPVEERQQAIVEGTQVFGSVLARGVQKREEQKQRERERARNAELEEVEETPSCECGADFDRIPDSDRIRCDECGRVYEVDTSV